MKSIAWAVRAALLASIIGLVMPVVLAGCGPRNATRTVTTDQPEIRKDKKGD